MRLPQSSFVFLASSFLSSSVSAFSPSSKTLHLTSRGIAASSLILFSVNADSGIPITNSDPTMAERYRKDGVRITHDPYAPGMAEKYGLPGQTDPEGFDPYSDTVGPGIYGGSVERDANGDIVIGQQYQNHNHRPGPVYDGKGYSLMSRAIHAGPDKVKEILADYPELKEEVSTGGARPLHICGMSQKGQLSTQVLIDAGADIYAQDTYGYTALHRMASNNLAIGGEALVKAGHDPNMPMKGADSTPIEIARRSRAIQFLMKMQELGHYE
jgi:Ankyrin repeats (many copies)